MPYMKFSVSLLAFPDIENLRSVITLDFLKMKYSVIQLAALLNR